MFITFEGIEGSGKSLQIGMAERHLADRGIECLLTREPGGTEFGRAVRRVLLGSEGPARDAMSELLLYLADRCEHLRQVVQPALESGVTVLSDRYHDATRAYQGAARGVPLETIDRLAAILRIPEPDKTILLDLEAAEGVARARARNALGGTAALEGRFEAEELSFHLEVRRAYLRLARKFPQRIHVIDAAGSPEEVFSRIRPLLDEWFFLGRA